MPNKPVKKSTKKTSAIAHQRGKSLPDALGEVPSDIAALNWGERLDIIDAWAQVLDGVYAHLPLKRSEEHGHFGMACSALPAPAFLFC